MDMFLYLDKDTFLHRLDPRTKLLVVLATFTVALMFDMLQVLLALTAIILIYGYLGKVLSNLKRIRAILLMIAFFSIFLWSFTRGGVTRLLGPVTLEGIIYGFIIGIKFDVMIISGMIFLSSTKIEEISLGLVKLRVPYRGAFAFSTAIRLVPMIVGTSYTITQAQKSRGLDLDSGTFIQKFKKYVPLLIPTLISIIRGTNVFAMALESKGFGYDDSRTNYLEIGFDRADYLVIALTVSITAFSIFAKINHLF
ncbi:MAG TPA: energy-coupling factor transporter transmembrane component T [Clostridia bacterium]|nr:energy-coupling factor transporter transmembrane component T [Clostridia bacterium]